jgi:hypothetical protein
MPFLELRRLQPRLNLPADAGTWQFSLPRRGQIRDLHVFFEWTNGATSNQTEPPEDAVDLIEIIGNGSTRLYSLTGREAERWTHALLKQRPRYQHDEGPGVAQIAHFVIPFGLPEIAENYYLNCESWQNLELRITYSPTIAATQYATGTGYVTVYANMWTQGQPGANNGLLKLTEQYYFTSVASGDVFYDLPIGNPYLALGLMVHEAGIDPQTDISQFQLNVENGLWIPVDGLFQQLQKAFAAELGIETSEDGKAYKSDTDTIETWAGSLDSFSLETIQTLTIGTTDWISDHVSTIAGGRLTLQSVLHDAAVTAADAANTTDHYIKWIARGENGIGDFLFVPFGFPDKPQNALQSGSYGRCRAVMTNGGAGAEVRLSLMEVVRPTP